MTSALLWNQQWNWATGSVLLGWTLNWAFHTRVGCMEKLGSQEKGQQILKEESELWRAFKNEIRFIATHFCHWNSHPNIIKYHGLAILKAEEDGGCVPYLLSERVEWNLLSLLEDHSEEAYLSQRFKVFHHPQYCQWIEFSSLSQTLCDCACCPQFQQCSYWWKTQC